MEPLDVTSPEFRKLPAAERIARLREAEDAPHEESKAKPRDPAIDKIAARYREEMP